VTKKLGSWVKSLWPDRASGLDARSHVDLPALQEACDRLTLRLGEELLGRTELMSMVADLEPIGRQLLRLLKETRARDGNTRATRLVEEALQHIYDCLYSVQPFRGYIWPEQLRHKLRRTLHSLDHALVALRWAQVQAGAA
jgi:hypothetical protein